MSETACIVANMRTIMVDWLIRHNYDGLWHDHDCACKVDDLMPCDEPLPECMPGHKILCPGHEFCEWDGPPGHSMHFHIGMKQEGRDEQKHGR